MKFLSYEMRTKLRNTLYVHVGEETISNMDNDILGLLINGEHKGKTITDYIKESVKEIEATARVKRKLLVYLVNETLATTRVLQMD